MFLNIIAARAESISTRGILIIINDNYVLDNCYFLRINFLNDVSFSIKYRPAYLNR